MALKKTSQKKSKPTKKVDKTIGKKETIKKELPSKTTKSRKLSPIAKHDTKPKKIKKDTIKTTTKNDSIKKSSSVAVKNKKPSKKTTPKKSTLSKTARVTKKTTLQSKIQKPITPKEQAVASFDVLKTQPSPTGQPMLQENFLHNNSLTKNIIHESVTAGNYLPSDYNKKADTAPNYFFHSILPQHYDKTYMRALPRDPYWIFAYWELSKDVVYNLKQMLGEDNYLKSRWITRIYDVTDIPNNLIDGNNYFDIEINSYAHDWYIKVPYAAKTYCIQFGVISPDNLFYALITSNTIQMPPDKVNTIVDDQWNMPQSDELINFSLAPLITPVAAEENLDRKEEKMEEQVASHQKNKEQEAMLYTQSFEVSPPIPYTIGGASDKVCYYKSSIPANQESPFDFSKEENNILSSFSIRK